METEIHVKANILSELWMQYRDDEDFEQFFRYNDVALPLAYAISEGIVKSTPLAETFINETFKLLLRALELESDSGFENLDELLVEAGFE